MNDKQEVIDKQIVEFDPAVKEQPADNMLAIINNAAQNPGVDVDKMRALLDMQKEISAHQAFIEFANAMAQVQSEVPQIIKRARNLQTSSNYAKQEDIAKELVPVATSHGFSMMFGTGKAEKENWIKATCWLMHRGGHKEYHDIDFPYDKTGIKGTVNKTDVHAAKSAYTYGRTTLTCLMFNVATTDASDDDGNGATQPVKTITEEQEINIQSVIDEIKDFDKTVFFKWVSKGAKVEVNKISEIPASAYKPVMAALEEKRKGL